MKYIQSLFAFIQKRKKLAIGLLVVAIIGIVGWNIFGPKDASTQYQTATATKGTLIESVTASGTVSVANKVSVTTAASGVVKQLFVKSGDTVAQGDKIAEITLDNNGQQRQTAAYAAYLASQNTINSDQANINTLQSTLFKTNQAFVNDRGVANPTDQQKADPVYIEENDAWLAAQAAYINQQSVIAKDQASVSNAYAAYQEDSSIITAPAAGTIADVQVAPGMQIGSSTSTSTTTTNLQTVANIKTEGQMSVVVDTAEVDVAKVQVGQKVTLTFDSLPNQTFTGTVLGINTTGTTSSGVTTYPTTIVLDSPEDSIYANMSVTANIVTKVDKDVIMVPSASVQSSNGQDFVRILQNGQVASIPVTTGDANDTQTVITSGISDGQTVVTGVTAPTTSSTSTGASPFSGGLRGFGGAGGAVFRTGGGGGGGNGRGG